MCVALELCGVGALTSVLVIGCVRLVHLAADLVWEALRHIGCAVGTGRFLISNSCATFEVLSSVLIRMSVTLLAVDDTIPVT